MIRERRHKEKFLPFEMNGNRIDICWGATQEFERVYTVDEETGKPVFTGEMKETDWVSCIHERYMKKPSFHEVKNLVVKGKELYGTYGTVSELRRIAEGFGVEGERLVSFLKEMLLKMIALYDSSDKVNGFTIGGVHVWLDKATRVGLKLRFESEVAAGKTETTLWMDGMSFPLPLVGDGNALQMLVALELYASDCYDRTQQHIAAVTALATADELEAYDYTLSYPEKLAF